MNVLELISKHHKVWLSYLHSLGCRCNCEDVVQEMYIKVDSYVKKHNADIMFNDTEINYYFFWITLKNLYTDYHRKKNNEPIIYKDTIHDVVESYEDIITSDDFEKHRAIIEWFEDSDYIQMRDDVDNLLEYDRKKLNKYYLRRIFEECLINEKSVAELSRDLNITYWSLRNTIKIIKKQIQKEYEIR